MLRFLPVGWFGAGKCGIWRFSAGPRRLRGFVFNEMHGMFCGVSCAISTTTAFVRICGTGKWSIAVEKNSGATKHHPRCSLSHLCMNKLSVIIGSCQLLLEEQDRSKKAAAWVRRLELIQEAARDLVNEVRTHECELEAKIAVLDGAVLSAGGRAVDSGRERVGK